jgi:hypothetical protein
MAVPGLDPKGVRRKFWSASPDTLIVKLSTI